MESWRTLKHPASALSSKRMYQKCKRVEPYLLSHYPFNANLKLLIVIQLGASIFLSFQIMTTVHSEKNAGPDDPHMRVIGLHQKRPANSCQSTRFQNESKDFSCLLAYVVNLPV